MFQAWCVCRVMMHDEYLELRFSLRLLETGRTHDDGPAFLLMMTCGGKSNKREDPFSISVISMSSRHSSKAKDLVWGHVATQLFQSLLLV